MNVKDVSTTAPYCLQCFTTERLSRCSRCNSAYYCCKDHQVSHWAIHKKSCKPAIRAVSNDCASSAKVVVGKISNNSKEVIDNSTKCQNSNLLASEGTLTDNSIPVISANNSTKNGDHNRQPEIIDSVYTNIPYADSIGIENTEKLCQLLDGNDMFSSLSSECLSSSNDYWDILNDYDPGSLSLNFDLNIPSNPIQSETVISSNKIPPSISSITSKSSGEPLQTVHNISPEDLCRNIINDLNEYGICVLDNFLGSNLGDLIFAEVNALFMKGIFRKGELVGSGYAKSDNIRGDVITWINGSEESCHYIGCLIKKLDVLMAAANKMPNNGVLGEYKLSRRTKAMIACYPGDGTHYKKHVDNPNQDGRCITCIYYLNKKWDQETHGGVLRMFPVANESVVANIEPIFDRMLFFWSDRRNPHEVLPSYAIRFAITVWYFDSDERDRALLKYRAQEECF